MRQDNCIFCQVVENKIGSTKIWEDNEFLAILDINPNTRGATLLIPKDHYSTKLFEMPDAAYQRLWLAAKKVNQLLERSLGVVKVGAVVEGMGVDHAHIKFYPLHGIQPDTGEAKERTFFEKYPGYISTQLGPEANAQELDKLAQEIRKYTN
jgi:diadenosine tetraphosphate (Ap4A) HIT family hydrolase